MKKMYFLLALLCISVQSLYSVEFDKSKLPKLLGANNWGREFYFSFIPGYGSWEGNIIIYISSSVRTKVVLEILGVNRKKTFYTIPNDIIGFSIAPSEGQVYNKYDFHIPEPDQIWKKKGIHVISDDPIICYGVTRHLNNAEGFLALPINKLSKEYIISSYQDKSNNIDNWFPSYTSITGAFNKTKVFFVMGGNQESKTVSGQLPGDSTIWNLDAGDVLLIGNLGSGGDLTGSKIIASKPVAVISGNYNTSVQSDLGSGNMLEEMELPTEYWGTTYHVTRIINRLKNSIIRIFAKEPNTNIYRDNDLIGTIQTSGGISGIGWLDMRADTGMPRPITIHSDKLIGVTQYNTGQQDDGTTSAPFQMVLVPTEQYQTEITFNTPGLHGGFGFPDNYINLCYEVTDSNTVPDDLEFATVEGGEFVWQKLKEIYPYPDYSFDKINNKRYFSKMIRLPDNGVYKIKANKPFQAYSYGFSSWDSYGFPASVALKKLDIIDTLPPEPEWSMNCHGGVNEDKARSVSDKPDLPEPRANLSDMYLHTDVSYNYIFKHDDFMPCEDSQTAWSLETIDPMQDGLAIVTFLDCAGNDTTLVFEYEAMKLLANPENVKFENVKIGNNYNQKVLIKNITETREIYLRNISLAYGTKGFSVLDSNMNEIELPIKLSPKDSIFLNINFVPQFDGFSRDTLILTDLCIVVNKKIPIVGFTEGTSVELDEKNTVQLYPNPTEDILIIDKIPVNTNKILIFDELGKEVRKIEIINQTENLKISTKDLPVGSYILRMFAGSEVLVRKFIIIR